MSDEIRFGCVIEPSVQVVNGLLDVARHLAGDLGPKVTGVAWVPPHQYVAPLAMGSLGSAGGEEAAGEALRLATRELEEFGVQMAPPVLLRQGDAEGLIMVVLTSKGDELAAVTSLAASRLNEIGMDVQALDTVGVTLALVTGEPAMQAVSQALPEGRDTPRGGWLVGGLCLHAGLTNTDGRGWSPVRMRYAPLLRQGSRR